MPRQPRLDLPGIPQHVVQRGNDRQPCFFEEADFLRYLQELKELALRQHCAVHAYVLMTNHVHLLLTPSAAGQVAALMQALGRRYVRYVNDRHHRTGTLWEGSYKACLVDRESYLLHCYRYIELNPVRARMVDDPGGYRWSSYAANAHGTADPVVMPHPMFLALGRDAACRHMAYRELVRQAIADDDLAAIRLHVQRQHALGTDRFRAAIEAQLGRRAGPAKIGRPRKHPESAL
ncbi:transposase [Frateuria hangzhouensis]|uniref:transposase n=1 Tax=Frateuria hangzhouensis TaxID=2995589 RepID=UPI00226100C5|nr:transposase [Frateuria sp. STR12]MCX7513440.1 transposase [Frateuria sp. STR12]